MWLILILIDRFEQGLETHKDNKDGQRQKKPSTLPLSSKAMETMKREGTCLPLSTGVIYGPVRSRRLGNSLGINLSPQGRKICSFDCVYCHFGWSDQVSRDTAVLKDEVPDPERVQALLEDYLKKNPSPDYITFSGSGEASLNPWFGEVVESVLALRDRLVPHVKVTILSNSTTAGDSVILAALAKLDIRFMKLDCGNEKTFQRFNRPATGMTLAGIMGNLSQMNMPIIIQTMLAGGQSGNFNPGSLDGYVNAVSTIKPRSIHLYSLDRPTPDGSLQGLSGETLREFSQRITRSAGVTVEVFGPRKG